MDKKGYVRIMIEARGCEAKALADGYFKSEKYEVIERSDPKPVKGGLVRIYLHVVRKKQAIRRGSSEDRMRRARIDREIRSMNVESLMSHAF